jgi:hypothetical protein
VSWADVSHYGAESRFHKEFTEQQHWHSDKQSSVNAIIPEQGIQALEIYQGGKHKHRQPGDDDQNSSSGSYAWIGANSVVFSPKSFW